MVSLEVVCIKYSANWKPLICINTEIDDIILYKINIFLFYIFQEKLLIRLDESELELPTSQEDECVICINARATMQTSPCGHRVVCRKCFVKTIQSAVAQRLLPLRCVICRTRINRLKSNSSSWRFQSSASSFSVGAKSWNVSYCHIHNVITIIYFIIFIHGRLQNRFLVQQVLTVLVHVSPSLLVYFQ